MKKNDGITLIILVITLTIILIILSISVPRVSEKIQEIDIKREQSFINEIQESIKNDIMQAQKNGLIQGSDIYLNVLENILDNYNGVLIEEDLIKKVQITKNNKTYKIILTDIWNGNIIN